MIVLLVRLKSSPFVIFCLLVFGFLFPHPILSQENAIPVITSITIAETSLGDQISALNLTENSTTSVYIHGSATDADSCQQIDAVSGSSSWRVVFYRSDLAQSDACTADDLNCYQALESDSNLTNCDSPEDTTLDYEMQIPIAHFADATDADSSPDYSTTNWTAFVEVTDDLLQSTFATSTTEINTLKALSVTPMVNYGVIGFAEESTEQSVTITNTGNDNDLDPMISDSEGWICTIGTLTSDAVTFNTTPGLGWAAGLAVTATPADVNDLSLIKSTGTVNPTANVYLTLKLPESGLAGSCSSTLVFGGA